MIKLYKNYSLKKHNTFGIDATAAAFVEISDIKDLRRVLQSSQQSIYVLGGGSNVLFTSAYYDILFIKNGIKGIRIIENNDLMTDKIPSVIVEIGAGEDWHDVVLWAVNHDLGGLENLSLIPGTVGAAPIQNIGAYGIELKDVLHSVEFMNIQTLENHAFTSEDCQFGYRNSIFKTTLKGQFFITKVFLKLTPPQYHTLNISYGDIQKTLAADNITSPTIKDVSNVVIKIRQSKLPDPAVIGNAGSFFKNPEIPTAQFADLKALFPLIVGYPTANDSVKVAAGWLIEQAGWKGKRIENVGVHDKQALVLVNYGKCKGLEIIELAQMIQAAVLEKFNITLLPEVNFV